MSFNKLLQPRLPERSLEVLNALVFAATLAVALTGVVRHVPWWVTVIVAILLVLIYLVVAASRYYSTFAFGEGSPELCKFFTDWYKRPGDHTLFCDNLDWMAGPGNAPIRAALVAHGDGVTICLRRTAGSVFDELREAGVKMRTVHDHVHMRAKISIKHDDGLWQMIVRIKGHRENDDKVRFRRLSDSFSNEMAHEFVINSSKPLD